MTQDSILRWCAEQGIEVSPGDPAVIAEYERSMREETIPAIEKAMREQARLAAEFRYKVLF